VNGVENNKNSYLATIILYNKEKRKKKTKELRKEGGHNRQQNKCM